MSNQPPIVRAEMLLLFLPVFNVATFMNTHTPSREQKLGCSFVDLLPRVDAVSTRSR